MESGNPGPLSERFGVITSFFSPSRLANQTSSHTTLKERMVNPLIPRPLFTSNSPLQALLTRLHRISLAQEAEGYGGLSSASITPNRQGGVIYPNQDATSAELSQFKEKLVALDEDKASFVNLTLKAMGAQRVFEGEQLREISISHQKKDGGTFNRIALLITVH